ncbi:hypothetical protein GGX14DRAFT_394902 [Mycena pura]|uniref:Uncharacterized protein n=1 Tax=Mycena pura TaxID=153505 RepID=A0AAD6YD59_9AGAR|nr:hypothetical protein GGX14DRAFT_394902 [Mycena pura]
METLEITVANPTAKSTQPRNPALWASLSSDNFGLTWWNTIFEVDEVNGNIPTLRAKRKETRIGSKFSIKRSQELIPAALGIHVACLVDDVSQRRTFEPMGGATGLNEMLVEHEHAAKKQVQTRVEDGDQARAGTRLDPADPTIPTDSTPGVGLGAIKMGLRPRNTSAGVTRISRQGRGSSNRQIRESHSTELSPIVQSGKMGLGYQKWDSAIKCGTGRIYYLRTGAEARSGRLD